MSSSAGSAFEPDGKWKLAMHRRIFDNGLLSIGEDARKSMQRELLEAPIGPDDLQSFLAEFDAIQRELNNLAEVHFTGAVSLEKRRRRWEASLRSKEQREAENIGLAWRMDQETEVLRRVQEHKLLLETVRSSQVHSQARQSSPAPRNVPPTPRETPPRSATALDKGKGRQISESPPPAPPMRSRSVSTSLTEDQRQRQQDEFAARREDMARRKRDKESSRRDNPGAFGKGLIHEEGNNSRRSTPAPADPSQWREPDELWKAATRKQVERQMSTLVQDAKDDLENKLRKATTERQRHLLNNEYNDTMRSLRMLAHEQYDEAVKRERNVRKLTTGEQPPDDWTEEMEKEQQALFDNFDMDKEHGRLTPAPEERAPPRQHSYSVPPDRQMPIDIKPGGSHRRPSFASSYASNSYLDVVNTSSPRLSPEQEQFKLRELAIAKRHEERQRRDSGAGIGRSISRGTNASPGLPRPSTSVPFTDYGVMPGTGSSSPRRPSGWPSSGSYTNGRSTSDAIAIVPPKLNTSQSYASYGSPGTSAGSPYSASAGGVMDPTEWRRRQQELVKRQQAQFRA